MINEHNTFATWGYGIAILLYATIALQFYRRNLAVRELTLIKIALMGALSSTVIWSGFGLAINIANTFQYLFFYQLFDVLRYSSWHILLILLLHSNNKIHPPIEIKWLKSFAGVLFIFQIIALLFNWVNTEKFENEFRFIFYGMMFASVFSLILIEQLFRNSSNDSKWSIKPFCIGLAGSFLFDLYLFSEKIISNYSDIDAINMRGLVHASIAPLLLISIFHRRDWVTNIKISPKAAFQTTALLAIGFYLIFISIVGYYLKYFGGNWGRVFQIGLLFVALIFLTIVASSESARAKLRVLLRKNFFKYRFDYREEWLKFTKTLSSESSIENVGLQIIQGLANMLESPAGALWIKNPDKSTFSQMARWNFEINAEDIDEKSALCEFMTQSGWIINMEEYKSNFEHYKNLNLPSCILNASQAWLIIPLLVGEDLIGFVVLAYSRTHMDVNWEVNDLLKTAGRQAASYLMQMQSTEALLEIRKFDAFNRMSAFVVHDLKNIVTQLSLMMKNAERLNHNPEFQQDMLSTVENSLNRMRQLMLQLHEGNTPSGTTYGVDLRGIIHKIEMLSSMKGRNLNVKLGEPVFARGHEDRLERVIGHIVQNALDATDTGGNVWINLDNFNGQARVIIGDTGIGMSSEFIKNKLFKPFQSTKENGMGIGTYESAQYIKELGGCIEVDSNLNRGTTISIFLPLLNTAKKSAPHLMENT